MHRISASRLVTVLKERICTTRKLFASDKNGRDESRLLNAKPFSEVPRLPSLPLVGTSWYYCPIVGVSSNFEEASWEMYRRYGPIVAEENPDRGILVHLFSADDFRTLYQQEGKTPHRSGLRPVMAYHRAKPFHFPDVGIMNVQGEEWRRVRSAVQQTTLRPKTVHSYVRALEQVSEDALTLIAAQRDENGEVGDCREIMDRWSLESTVFVALHRRLGLLQHHLPKDSDGSVILRAIGRLVNVLDGLMVKVPFSHYFTTNTAEKIKSISDEVVPRLFGIFNEAISASPALTEGSGHSTIWQQLLRDRKLNIKEIFTFINDLLIAGTHTTSSTATFCLYRLAENPEAQEKARREALTAHSELLNDDTPTSLPYIRACIKESLRLTPVAPGVDRKFDHDVVMSGYRIPVNTEMRTILSVAGRLEENFTNANQFVPERWLRPNEEDADRDIQKGWKLHPFASVPFSSGSRMCVGRTLGELGLSVLLAKVLKKYTVENHHGDIGPYSRFMTRPRHPAKFRFVEVHSSS